MPCSSFDRFLLPNSSFLPLAAPYSPFNAFYLFNSYFLLSSRPAHPEKYRRLGRSVHVETMRPRKIYRRDLVFWILGFQIYYGIQGLLESVRKIFLRS